MFINRYILCTPQCTRASNDENIVKYDTKLKQNFIHIENSMLFKMFVFKHIEALHTCSQFVELFCKYLIFYDSYESSVKIFGLPSTEVRVSLDGGSYKYISQTQTQQKQSQN